jgi:hypothetical protein
LNLSKLFVVSGSFFEKVMRRSSERSCEGEQCACEARKSCEAVFERAGWGRVSEFVSACQKKSITHSKERETEGKLESKEILWALQVLSADIYSAECHLELT